MFKFHFGFGMTHTSNDFLSQGLRRKRHDGGYHAFTVPDGGLRFSNLLNCTFFRGEIQVPRKETKILKDAA